MIDLLQTLAVDLRTTYDVPLDDQYIYLIAYIVPLVLGSMLRRFVGGKLSYILGGIFAVSFAAYWVMVMIDQPLNRIIVPIIILVGIASGLSAGIRFLLKKVKNIGDDNKWIG